jgi:uncharacterized protein (DUF305 family)
MRLRSAIAALVTLVALAGCSSHGTAEHSAGGAPEDTFLMMMIPHHEQAVQMADLAPTRASSSVILDLAATIKQTQAGEIEQMRGWLSERGVQETDHSEHMGMQGMLTPEQLDELAAADGDEFDRLFAQYMIEHHKGAVAMANEVIASGSDEQVLAFARQVIADQEAEIAQMQGFLGQ